jgi:6-phosphofructokinase 2
VTDRDGRAKRSARARRRATGGSTPAIVTLTLNPAIDLSSTVDRLVPGHKLRCAPPRGAPRGGGIHIGRAIHKLGGAAVVYYPAGGPTGQALRRLLDREGLVHHAIPIHGWTRINGAVTEESTHEQYRFVAPGPELSGVEWQRCLDEVAGIRPAPRYVAASGSLPPGVPDDFYARLGERVRAAGGRFVLDTSGAALVPAVAGGVYLVKPSLRELSQLAGREIRGASEQCDVARHLVESGKSEVVLLSLGADGALMGWAGGSARLRPPTVPVRSTVGAGDSMLGGFLLALVRGESLTDAFRFAVAAATASVMNPGTELCDREQTEQLYGKLAVE